jgi:hypothetical protein
MKNTVVEKIKMDISSFNKAPEAKVVFVRESDLGQALSRFHFFLKKNSIPWPQVLDHQKIQGGWEVVISCREKFFEKIETQILSEDHLELLEESFATLISKNESDQKSLLENLNQSGIVPRKVLVGLNEVTTLVSKNH